MSNLYTLHCSGLVFDRRCLRSERRTVRSHKTSAVYMIPSVDPSIRGSHTGQFHITVGRRGRQYRAIRAVFVSPTLTHTPMSGRSHPLTLSSLSHVIADTTPQHGKRRHIVDVTRAQLERRRPTAQSPLQFPGRSRLIASSSRRWGHLSPAATAVAPLSPGEVAPPSPVVAALVAAGASSGSLFSSLLLLTSSLESLRESAICSARRAW